MIVIESKRKKPETLLKKYPNAVFCDVTSKSAYLGLRQLSPFFPWGGIPVSFTPGVYSYCVEAVWQGLKVFENADVDTDLFSNNTMIGLKRSTRVFGKVLGHRQGVGGEVLLNYLEARKKIYIPTYKWMLEHKAFKTIEHFRAFCQMYPNTSLVLLDYQTNCNIEDLTKPLSHAFLIKSYIEGSPPYDDVLVEKIVHHVVVGRRVYEWQTKDFSFKELPVVDDNNKQLAIDFDE